MLSASSEIDLIHRAKNGDAAAFAELLRAIYLVAFRLAYGLVHDIDEAEDIVQEASLTAWRRLGNVREGRPLRPWLLAIVANKCRAAAKRRRWSALSTEQVFEDVGDIATRVDLHRALACLRHDDRLVLLLRYYLDLPFEEIALALSISPKGARSRVHRALERLRPMLQTREVFT